MQRANSCKAAPGFRRGPIKRYAYKGNMWPISKISREAGIGYETLKERLRAGWPMDVAVGPVRQIKRRKMAIAA